MKIAMIMAVAASLSVPAMAQQKPAPDGSRNARAEEMRRAMQEPDYVFARMDTNRDGVISKAEFRVAHAKVLGRMAEHREHRMERRMERRQQR